MPPSVTNGLPNGIETGHFQGWLYSGGAVGQSGSKRISIMRRNGDYKIYENVLNTGMWAGWKEIATATPPKEYDLPLAEGIIVYPEYKAAYHRNQFGEVTVALAVKKQDGSSITYGEVIATLPAGHRPSSIIAVPAEGNVQTGVFGSNLVIQVYPDGSIIFHTSGELGAIDLGVCITFLASS